MADYLLDTNHCIYIINGLDKEFSKRSEAEKNTIERAAFLRSEQEPPDRGFFLKRQLDFIVLSEKRQLENNKTGAGRVILPRITFLNPLNYFPLSWHR